MERQQIINRMDKAFRQDRERFFVVADAMEKTPKYADRKEEIEAVKQQWRDAPSLPDYPNIDHPIILPNWFSKINFASSWKKDSYIDRMLNGDLHIYGNKQNKNRR